MRYYACAITYLCLYTPIFGMIEETAAGVGTFSPTILPADNSFLTPHRKAPQFHTSSTDPYSRTPSRDSFESASEDQDTSATIQPKKRACLRVWSAYTEELKYQPCVLLTLPILTATCAALSISQAWCNPLKTWLLGSCQASDIALIIGQLPLACTLLTDAAVTKRIWFPSTAQQLIDEAAAEAEQTENYTELP